ncbi:MAG: hypothetical protein ACTHZX_00535 [Microbacterium sp.]
MRAADGAARAREGTTGTIGPDELYPPAQYAGWWLLLAVGILVVIVGVVWLILLLTRQPKAPREPRPEAPRTPVEQLERLRAEHLARIDEIERAHRAGELDAREVSGELSTLTRRFVNEYTGVATPVMSLEEIADHRVHPALVQALAQYYYPSIFGEGEPADPAAGIAAAREVVTAWH